VTRDLRPARRRSMADLDEAGGEGAKGRTQAKVRDGGERAMRQIRDLPA